MLLITVGWVFCGLCFWYALAVLQQRTTDRREQQTAEMQARVEQGGILTAGECVDPVGGQHHTGEPLLVLSLRERCRTL